MTMQDREKQNTFEYNPAWCIFQNALVFGVGKDMYFLEKRVLSALGKFKRWVIK